MNLANDDPRAVQTSPYFCSRSSSSPSDLTIPDHIKTHFEAPMTQALDQQTSLVIFRKHASLTLGYSLGSCHHTQTPTERPDIPTLHSHK